MTHLIKVGILFFHCNNSFEYDVCVKFVCVCVECVCSLPVQPGQQTLGGSDQLNHGGEEFVGGLMGDLAVVGGVLPALRHGVAQAVVRRSHLPHQSLQVVRLHTVVLSKKTEKITHVNIIIHDQKTTFPISPVITAYPTFSDENEPVGNVIQQISDPYIMM